MSKLKKMLFLALCVLAVSVAFTGLALAVEEDGEGNIVQSKTLTLDGDEIPAPKPKVIIREKIVHQCPRGYGWNAEVGKCLDADGNEFAPAHRHTPQPRAAAPSYGLNDKYVFPESLVRVRVGQCVMQGETVSCSMMLINTGDGTRVFVNDPQITDNLGMSYKTENQSLNVGAGDAAQFEFKFKYVNTSATSLQFTAKLMRMYRGSKDYLKFSLPILR